MVIGQGLVSQRGTGEKYAIALKGKKTVKDLGFFWGTGFGRGKGSLKIPGVRRAGKPPLYRENGGAQEGKGKWASNVAWAERLGSEVFVGKWPGCNGRQTLGEGGREVDWGVCVWDLVSRGV